MKLRTRLFACILATVTVLSLSACSNGSDNSKASSKSSGSSSAEIKVLVDKDSELLELTCGDNPTLYISNIPDFPEFSSENEGTAFIDSNLDIIYISITKTIEEIDGAAAGPMAVFSVNYKSDEVVRADFIEHDDETLDISDERMIEIAKDLKKIIDDNNK